MLNTDVHHPVLATLQERSNIVGLDEALLDAVVQFPVGVC